MSRHTLSVLVEDTPGVLARVAILFSRRGFNIESLAVGPTEVPQVSRMTIVVNVEGAEFGALGRFEDLPAGAVMVVKGERERWIPVTGQHLRSIDSAARRIVVDWPEDF